MRKHRIPSRVFTLLVYVFLYAPIILLIVFSFNATKSNRVWGGFSLDDARTVCGEAEELREGAVITGTMTEAQAKAAAGKLGAVSMLRVL